MRVHPRRPPSRSVYPRPSRSVPVAVLSCCTHHPGPQPCGDPAGLRRLPLAGIHPSREESDWTRASRVATEPRTCHLFDLPLLPDTQVIVRLQDQAFRALDHLCVSRRGRRHGTARRQHAPHNEAGTPRNHRYSVNTIGWPACHGSRRTVSQPVPRARLPGPCPANVFLRPSLAQMSPQAASIPGGSIAPSFWPVSCPPAPSRSAGRLGSAVRSTTESSPPKLLGR